MNQPHSIKEGDRAFGRVLSVVIALMTIPFIFTLFMSEMRWSVIDFIALAMIATGVGTVFLISSDRVVKSSHRAIIAFVCSVILLYAWAELAVGVFTDLGS